MSGPPSCFSITRTSSFSRTWSSERARRAIGVFKERAYRETAYNFVSLAHDEETIDRTLDILGEVLGATR